MGQKARTDAHTNLFGKSGLNWKYLQAAASSGTGAPTRPVSDLYLPQAHDLIRPRYFPSFER
jgi:hypothetical protein